MHHPIVKSVGMYTVAWVKHHLEYESMSWLLLSFSNLFYFKCSIYSLLNVNRVGLNSPVLSQRCANPCIIYTQRVTSLYVTGTSVGMGGSAIIKTWCDVKIYTVWRKLPHYTGMSLGYVTLTLEKRSHSEAKDPACLGV